jgi:tRNA-2-methylthio-N6-dimethylallyladenosine synthase
LITAIINQRISQQVKGRIDQGRPVYLEGDIEELKGKIVPVQITDVGAYYLVGKLVGMPR